jgi:phage-related protein
MAAALEALNGLTAATEAANIIAKTTSGLMEVVGKALSSIVNLFIQPLAPLMTYLMGQLYLAMVGFKAWWDNLPKWFDEKVFEPIKKWIDQYIIQPFLDFINNVKKWVDENLVKPFWNFFNGVSLWIDTYIVKPFWSFISGVEKWVDDFIVKPFWKWFNDIPKWIDDNMTKPFWNFISGVPAWVDDNISKPFWNAISGITKWVDDNITKPFWNAVNSIYGYMESVKSWVESGFKAVANTIVRVINWLLDAARSVASKVGLGGVVPANIPFLQSGGLIKETGIAVVHQGETVVPKGAGGSNITLNFYGYQDDKFIQKVKDVLRSQGTVYNL